uniref:Pectinesterase inhibitor domain-containing protein n=1 Tax=Fagus sylvatica TaxID=28930 RepID=A0A2N9HSX4_FAGSY
MEGAYTTSYHALITILITLLFISNFHTTLASTSSTTTTEYYNSYVKTACNSTTYPKECNKALYPLASKIKANPQKLCSNALSISIKAAKNSSSTISKLSKSKGLTQIEVGIIKDCIENIKDSIDELKQSLNELGHLGSSNARFQIYDIQTWVSAAITDEYTCTDGFDGQSVSKTVKNTIRKSILSVARPTSNALSLINNHYSY